MAITNGAVELHGVNAFNRSYRWEDRHRMLGRLVSAGLSVQSRLSSGPRYSEVATLGALAGLVGSARNREVAAAAVRALGSTPTMAATWRFAWRWWFQRSAGGVLDYQADRVTLAWAEQHVAAPASVPSGGCILVSVHNFNQRLAFARLGTLFDDLGGVGLFEPLPEGDPSLTQTSFGADAAAQVRARSRFCHEVFGPRLLSPRWAPRRGLELLRSGGSLIVLIDFFGREPVNVLGKRMQVPSGPLWWAAQSGRPIVPFAISPRRGERPPWQLWCGEPVDATPSGLASAVEECIRRAPTAWAGWPAWYAAPDYAG